MKSWTFTCILSALLLAAYPSEAQTAASFVGAPIRSSAAEIRAYWTPDRIAAAKPELGMVFPSVPEIVPEGSIPPVQWRVERPGEPPSILVVPGSERVYSADKDVAATETDALHNVPRPESEGTARRFIPDAVGTKGLYYTSTRLIPLAADQEYPYKTVGKLFFMTPAGASSCSASVIAKRVVLTAGHCVSPGNGGAFYNMFLFVPAFRDGAAPFGTWSPSYVATTTDWFNGNGSVPNPADYAMFAIQDRAQIGQPPQRIGDVLGNLGYLAASNGSGTAPNDIVNLGYPCNLDGNDTTPPPGGIGKMHQVNAGKSASGGNNTSQYGSDMGQGSSGGPWVHNFGISATGQPQPATNQVVGVNSYAFIAPAGCVPTNALAEGSSNFDLRFVALFNGVCGQAPGNC
jgi:V8-like Glu-specific endopeptidase